MNTPELSEEDNITLQDFCNEVTEMYDETLASFKEHLTKATQS